jgi:3-phenylpropionate/trans-cinnamate dioxygenase ferredoxin reductase subunit
MPRATVVIAGAGHGGVQVAASLRQNGFDGRVVLIGDEPGLPYQRPPLSKAYLQGKIGQELLFLRPASFYRDNHVELNETGKIAAIEPENRRVRLGSGEMLQYDHLVLAIGARNRLIQIGGTDLDGVFYLRTLAEVDALRPRLARAENIVVVGAGFIGLEFAAAAAKMGKKVHLIEAAERVMARVVGPQMSLFFERQHASWGSQFSFNTRPVRLIGEARSVRRVELADGRQLMADMAIISIGVVPNTEIALAAGLTVADGIAVDRHLLTSDSDISAIGDCALFPSVHGKGPVRLESVQNATDQARCVAGRLAGKPAHYQNVPWFWSDQGELKLQIVGLTAGHTHSALRGDVESGQFSIFHFAGERLLGIESVNRPADHMFGRRSLAADRHPTSAQIADPLFDLKAHVAG